MTIREALLRSKRRPRTLGTGSPTVYRGDGYEFVELRAYVPGDDVRRIDWAATARSGELQSRVILEDVALTLAAILDTSPSMRVGRKRPLHEAAMQAVEAWFGACRGDDRAIAVGSDRITPPALQRLPQAIAATLTQAGEPFHLHAALTTALGALARGTALLAIGDWFDLQARDDELLRALGARCDCTALIVRDPWFDELPLHGMVRLRGAEGGHARLYVGARERRAYATAVAARETALRQRFTACGWRTGLLHERDGAGSLTRAFGLPAKIAG